MNNLKWLKPVKSRQVSKQPDQAPMTVRHTKMEHFSGAMPHPDHLAQYEQTMPGASDRLMRMVETESEHRRAQEAKAVDAGIEDMRMRGAAVARGQHCALWIALAGLGVSGWIGMTSPTAGASLGGGIVAALAAAFLIGGSRSAKDEDRT